VNYERTCWKLYKEFWLVPLCDNERSQLLTTEKIRKQGFVSLTKLQDIYGGDRGNYAEKPGLSSKTR